MSSVTQGPRLRIDTMGSDIHGTGHAAGGANQTTIILVRVIKHHICRARGKFMRVDERER